MEKVWFLVLICLILVFSCYFNFVNAGVYFDWGISATAHETKIENYQGSNAILAKVAHGSVVNGIPSGRGAYDCKEFIAPASGTVNLDWSLESTGGSKGYGLVQIGTHGCSVSPIDVFYRFAVDDFPKSGSYSFNIVSGTKYYFYVFAGYLDQTDFDVTASIDYTWSGSNTLEWDITGYDSGSALASNTVHQNVDSFSINWQGTHGGSLSNIKTTYSENLQRVDSYISPANTESGSVYAKLINSVPIINLLSPEDGAYISDRTPLFEFSYYDFDGDSQYAFNVQIADNPEFSNIVFDTGVIIPGAVSYQIQPVNQLDKGKTYYWRVNAQDRQDTLGEWGEYSDIRSLMVENSAPVMDTINDIEIDENEVITIIVNATDPDGDSLAYYINDPRFTQQGNKFIWQTQEGDAGNYTVLITVSDSFSNVSQTVNIILNTVLIPIFVDVDPEYKSVLVGENFTINIRINTTQEVYALQFTLLYNSTTLSVNGVTEGDFLNKDGTSTYPVIAINNTEGKIVFADTRIITESGITGIGNLAIIDFSTKNVGSAILDLRNVEASSPEVEPLSIVVANGEVRIISLGGDTNGDCQVNIFDLAAVGLCYGCSSGQACWQNCEQADVKPDGVINIFDLATVGLNYGKTC